MVLIGLVTTVVTTLLLACKIFQVSNVLLSRPGIRSTVTTGSTSVALLGIEALVTTVACVAER